MSKVDAMRALKMARLDEQRKAVVAAGGAAPQRARAVPAASPTPTPRATASADASGECGHRNMGGRSCTRPSGHAEKSHRYG